MKTFRYFAYGSNMLTSRLQDRCASAAVETLASAAGQKLSFSKLSKDASGKGTLVAADVGSSVPGVVFRIHEGEADILRAAEGPGYEPKHDFVVTCSRTGEPVTTLTYLAVEHDHLLRPYDWYLALVLAGIREHELDDDHAALLKAIAYDVDPHDGRKERLDALAPLGKSGISDYKILLNIAE